MAVTPWGRSLGLASAGFTDIKPGAGWRNLASNAIRIAANQVVSRRRIGRMPDVRVQPRP